MKSQNATHQSLKTLSPHSSSGDFVTHNYVWLNFWDIVVTNTCSLLPRPLRCLAIDFQIITQSWAHQAGERLRDEFSFHWSVSETVLEKATRLKKAPFWNTHWWRKLFQYIVWGSITVILIFCETDQTPNFIIVFPHLRMMTSDSYSHLLGIAVM